MPNSHYYCLEHVDIVAALASAVKNIFVIFSTPFCNTAEDKPHFSNTILFSQLLMDWHARCILQAVSYSMDLFVNNAGFWGTEKYMLNNSRYAVDAFSRPGQRSQKEKIAHARKN